MGDRVSISFDNNGDESVVLFSHWGGKEFADEATKFLKTLRKDIVKKDSTLGCGPLGRMEPNTVMVDFIRHVTKKLKRVDGDLYLGSTSTDGDNSDNGHFKLDVKTGDVI
jgi:hypothetical protein